MDQIIKTVAVATDNKPLGTKSQVENNPLTLPETIGQRSRKISELNNLLNSVTSIGDVEKHFPGITEFYNNLMSARRKLRNLKSKQRKALKVKLTENSLSPNSKEFVPKLLKLYNVTIKDLVRPLPKFQGLVGADLEIANLLSRSIIEETVHLRNLKASSKEEALGNENEKE